MRQVAENPAVMDKREINPPYLFSVVLEITWSSLAVHGEYVFA